MDINPELSSKQNEELFQLLEEYVDIFQDVPRRKDLVEQEIVETHTESTLSKSYPTESSTKGDI